MDDELTSLYKLRIRLAANFEAATAAMPEKKALDHAVSLIAILENQERQANKPASEKVLQMQLRSKKPRTLVNKQERAAILDWLSQYFRKTNNRPTHMRRLTELMLADGMTIPGSPQTQVFVVTGLITRNKMFKGRDSLWHLAEYAAGAA